METITLYRPIGVGELELIANTSYKRFPPRLDWQPIFYPVLNRLYAVQIASEWNVKDEFSGFCGIVTEFDLHKKHYLKYQVQNVGGEIHNELWVPAEELAAFNENIDGEIRIVDVFFGDRFVLPANDTIAKKLNEFKKR